MTTLLREWGCPISDTSNTPAAGNHQVDQEKEDGNRHGDPVDRAAHDGNSPENPLPTGYRGC